MLIGGTWGSGPALPMHGAIDDVQIFDRALTPDEIWMLKEGESLEEIDKQFTPQYTHRHGYQGQFSERDLETGWNHFELREYDPVVGRWTSPDPMRQYWSTYVGMGNDPVSGVDPNGGWGIPMIWYPTGETLGEFIDRSLMGATMPAIVIDVPIFDPEIKPWYVQAWDSWCAGWGRTAKTFNMDDDPNAEGWNSAPMRGLVSDNIGLEVSWGGTAGQLGQSHTYAVNLFTRGPQAGFFLTKTSQKSSGLGGGIGINISLNHYVGPLETMTRDKVLGRTDTYSTSILVNGGMTLGYDDANKVIWSGVSTGVGFSEGASYSTGTTTPWKPF